MKNSKRKTGGHRSTYKVITVCCCCDVPFSVWVHRLMLATKRIEVICPNCKEHLWIRRVKGGKYRTEKAIPLTGGLISLNLFRRGDDV